MKRLLFYLLICGLMFLPAKAVLAEGTTVGTRITNEAIVEGINFGTVTNTAATQVSLIIGGDWLSQDIDILTALNVAPYTNISSLSNLGNGTVNFLIAVDAETNGVCEGYWSYDVYTNGDIYYSQLADVGDHAVGGNIPIGSGAAKTIMIVVNTPGGLVDGWNSFQLIATTPDTHANNARYQSDNTIAWFGGTAANGWGIPVLDQLTFYGTGVVDGSTDIVWRVTGAAAVTISIQKTIVGISSPSSGVSIIIPGATITYNIRISNASPAGTATGVVIKDTIDVVNLIMGTMSVISATELSWEQMTNANTLVWSNTDPLGAMEAGNFADLQFTAIVQ